jgi:hypothetical protein
MTTQIIDLSQIDLTGGLRLNGEAFRAAHINGERLWPFGVDLLYTGGIGGASYLPDPADVFTGDGSSGFGNPIYGILDRTNGETQLGASSAVTAWSGGWAEFSSDGGSFTGSKITAGGTDITWSTNTFPVVVGRFYEITVEVLSNTLPNVFGISLSNGTNGRSTGATALGAGIKKGIVQANVASGNFSININTTFVGTLSVGSVSIREVPASALPLLQLGSAPRPLLGRASRRGRVNLYADTERGLAANSLFGINPAGSGSVVGAIPGPDGDFAADLITLTNATDFHMIRRGNVGTSGQTLSFTARLKPAGYWKYAIADSYGGYNKYAAFDLQSKTVIYNQSLVGAPYIEELDDGWFRIGITAATAPVLSLALIVLPPDYVAPASAQSALSQWQADGVSGFYFGGLQAEVGGVTAHQRVSANLADISDPGIRSDQFVRFDLSDDNLNRVLPQAVTGDVVIAGRNGSVIAPHSYAANSTFQLGPTSYTGGTPGILRAIGDVVGWSILGKTLTAAERERLMRFYKRRGAKGLLVPGPELVVNGGFDTDLSGWSSGSQWSWDNGRARYNGPGNVIALLTQDQGLLPNRNYLISFTAEVSAQQFMWGFNFDQTVGGRNIATSGPRSAVLSFSDFRNKGVAFRGENTGNICNFTIDNVSVRELRPEEDW